MLEPRSLWSVAWVETRRGGAALVIKLLYPTLTIALMLLGRAPLHIAASVIVLLIAFMSVVDLGLSWERDRRSGLLARLALTPLSPRCIVAERLAASVTIDLLQTLPIVVLLGLMYRPAPAALSILTLALAAALLASNVLSLAVTLLPGGRREVILYAVILVFALLFLGGVFRPIGPGEGLLNGLAHLIPYAPLHQAVRLNMAQPAVWTEPEILLDALVLGGVALGLAWLLAPKLLADS